MFFFYRIIVIKIPCDEDKTGRIPLIFMRSKTTFIVRVFKHVINIMSWNFILTLRYQFLFFSFNGQVAGLSI